MHPSTSPLLKAISKFLVVVCVMGVMMMAASQYNLSYNLSTWLQPERIRHSSPHSNRTKWSSKHNDGVLRYFDSPVHVVQVGDDSYANLMYNHTLRNKQWAKCMDYEYKFISLDKEEIVSDNKPCVLVKHIRRALRSITKGDWMLFLDLDVQFASTTCTALDAILPTMSLNKSQPCEFMALGSYHTINTGVVIMRSTNSTMQLMDDWYKRQLEFQTCKGPGDQYSLQSVVLDYASNGKYSGSCDEVADGHHRNICFRNKMISHGYRKKSFQNVCLLSCSDGLQCKDCYYPAKGICNEMEAVFWHNKVPLNLPPPHL